MTDKLVEYVIELNTNPEALKKHNENPERAAADFGLDKKDIAVISNQDTQEIKRRCESAPGDVKSKMVTFFKQ